MTQNGPPELNKNDPDSLYNWVAYKVSCPQFRNPIKNFIDENCSTFIDIDENSFEQGQLYNEMNQLIENLLDDVLKEGQITQEDFLKAAERGMEDKKYKKYFNQIINFQNYTFFKSVMTKRNYQIIQMAEKQMKEEMENPNGQQEERQNFPPELVAQMLENEQNEINEAIKQSLADEDEKRRIAIIEEEELKRAIKQSLEQSQKEQKEKEQKEKEKKEETKKEEPKKEEPKKEEPKKEEHKKEEPKKEEPKKEEPKKFMPVISSQSTFQYSGEEKPEPKKTPEIVSEKKGFQLQVSSKAEEFGINNEKVIHKSTMPAPPSQEPPKKEEIYEKKEENIIKEEKKFTNTKTGENENIIFEQKKPERITRDFVNVFEEKKLTLAPLANKSNIQNPYKSSLKEDLQKNQKDKLKGDIERMNKKGEQKKEIPKESASDVIKNSLKQSSLNKNDINNYEDDGGLLIDDDEEEVVFKNDNKDNSKSHNIHFGKIAIPKDFNDKIPDYDKEKQDQLKEYREKVLKIKKEEREQQLNNFP